MKNYIKVLLFVLIVSLFTACSGSSGNENANSPNTTVEAYFKAVQSGEFAKANEYTTSPDENLDLTPVDPDDPLEERMINAVKSITYSIQDSSVNGNEATVTVDITTVNLGLILQQTYSDYITEMFSLSFSQEEEPSADELESILIGMLDANLNDDSIEDFTATVDIGLVKEDDSWKLIMNNELQNAITGGVMGLPDENLADENIEDNTDLLNEAETQEME